MRVQIHNVWSQAVEISREEERWIDEFLSCPDRSYAARLRGESMHHSYQRLTKAFPTGLLRPVVQEAARASVAIEWEDLRVKPCEPESDEDLMAWLRDYQKAAVRAVIQHGGRGLIKAPMAAGKTELMIGLARMIPCIWLFLVHRSSIVRQILKRIVQRTGEDAGTFKGGLWQRQRSNVTVATFQAVHHALQRRTKGVRELIYDCEGIAVDEVHAQAAETFLGVTRSLENAYFRVGLSGTPLCRTAVDNIRTMGALGTLAFEVPYDLLVRRGLLSQSKVRMVEHRSIDLDPASSWDEVYHQGIVRCSSRNKLLAEIIMQATHPSLVFVEELEHGHRLMRRMEGKGLDVAFVHGDHSVYRREEMIGDLVAGELDVLICSVVFQEGIDIPSLRSVIVGTGKKSTVAVLQQIGRGMRVDVGKRAFDVWDIFDTGHDYLVRHSIMRQGAYEEGGHEPIVVPVSALRGGTQQSLAI